MDTTEPQRTFTYIEVNFIAIAARFRDYLVSHLPQMDQLADRSTILAIVLYYMFLAASGTSSAYGNNVNGLNKGKGISWTEIYCL